MVVIAQDAQGAEVASPWIKKAGGTYRALLDQHNEIGKAYNVKFVPVGIFVDEEGHLPVLLVALILAMGPCAKNWSNGSQRGLFPVPGAMPIKDQNPAH